MALRKARATDFQYGVREKRTGDLLVGAYARRLMRKRVLLSLAGVALIVAAAALYLSLRPVSATEPTAAPIKVRCAVCQYETILTVPPDARRPLVCPNCNERGAHEMWRCRACGAEFVLMETASDLACPRCGSRQVGSAAVK